MIKMKYMGRDGLVCPVPIRLIQRVASGIFYDICNEEGFDYAFGNSFQSYVVKFAKMPMSIMLMT